MKALKYIIAIFFTMFICSCHEELNNTNEIDEFENMLCSDDPENDIIGRWKIVKRRVNFTPTGAYTISYSNNYFICEFKNNGNLIIFEYIDDTELNKNECSYELETRSGGVAGLNLMISFTCVTYGTWYTCCISNDLMYFDLSFLDGDTYYFKKITQ